MIDQLHEKKSAQTADTSGDADVACRGDPQLDLIREKSIVVNPNDLNMFEMEVAPGVLWDSLNEFVAN